MEHAIESRRARYRSRPSTHDDADHDVDLDHARRRRWRRCSPEAGEIALRWFRSELDAEDKGGERGYDPVTIADRDIEQLLRNRLSAVVPAITRWSARRPAPADRPAATAG